AMTWIVPCVAGCEGPMLTMTVSSRCGFVNAGRIGLGICGLGTCISMSAPAAPLGEVEPLAIFHQRLFGLFRIVLAQRVADEALVQQDRPQVGVAAEVDAVHLVAFALAERG